MSESEERKIKMKDSDYMATNGLLIDLRRTEGKG